MPNPRSSIAELMALAHRIKQPAPRPATPAVSAPGTTVAPPRASRFRTVSSAAPQPELALTAVSAPSVARTSPHASSNGDAAPSTDHREPRAGVPAVGTGRERDDLDEILAHVPSHESSPDLDFIDVDAPPTQLPAMPAADASPEEKKAAARRTLEFLSSEGVLLFDPGLEETDRLYPPGPTVSSVDDFVFTDTPHPDKPSAPLTAASATLKADIQDNLVFLAEEPGTGRHATLHALLTKMEAYQATDLHLQIGEPPSVRIQGIIRRLNHQPLEPEHMRSILYAVCTEADIKRLEEKSKRADNEYYAQGSDVLAEHDLTYTYAGTRYRTNVAIENRGTMVVMRRLKNDPPALQDLRMPPAVGRVLQAASGLVLITGATSAGKTTTMASLVRKLATEVEANIITIEDPIEYQYSTGLRSVVKQRQVGRDTHSFASGVRAALRQDPDVIVVGELLDATTAELALAAAQTGHLVFATMHAGSAAEVPGRIINFFPADQRAVVAAQLSGVLRLFSYQVLLPVATGTGVVPAFAITPITPALQSNIADMKFVELARSIEAAAREEDGCTLLDSIRALLNHNLVRVEDAVSALNKGDRDLLLESFR